MSLSPFDSFQSRFVTYLLNLPRISANCYQSHLAYYIHVVDKKGVKTKTNFPAISKQQCTRYRREVTRRVNSYMPAPHTGVLISPQHDQVGNKLQRPNSKFCKPLQKKKINGCPSNQVSEAAVTSASEEKWRPFNCFFNRVGLRTYQHPCNKTTVPYNSYQFLMCRLWNV